jgi:hypothetical protein
LPHLSLKRIIAREGLIIIAIAVGMYFLVSFLSEKIPVIYPKYRLAFADGKTYDIDIYPQVDYAQVFNPRAFLKEVCLPSQKLITKRIEEFRKNAKVTSSLKDSRCVNSTQLYFSALYSRFLSQHLLLKTLYVYGFLVALRFTLWAMRVLGHKRPGHVDSGRS